MKQLSIHIFKLIVFWLLLFALGRIIFLTCNTALLQDIPIGKILYVFVSALRLDVSTVGYLMLFSFVILLFYTLTSWRLLWVLHLLYVIICIIAIATIQAVDPILFKEWTSKVNYKSLTFLTNPTEAIQSSPDGAVHKAIVLILVQVIIFVHVYVQVIHYKLYNVLRSWKNALILVITMPILLGLGIRGGWQQIPINQSDAYFSTHFILNTAAVNTTWNLGQSIYQNQKYLENNPYVVFSSAKAKAYVNDIFVDDSTHSISLFNQKTPNIVLVILEGWSADMIEPLGGLPKVTPNFNKLCQQGLLFTQCYATGTLSDQGMVALLSGYPAQPVTRIIRQPDKFVKLPCINTYLQQQAYYTSFYFGGQLTYGNIKGYLYYNGFDKIVEGKDLPHTFKRGKLGVHDGDMFQYHLNELSSFTQPFFSCLFTASSHSPYDHPMKHQPFQFEFENDYANAIYYADSCLGNYMQQAAKQPWFDNTIFIFISDHSHNTPRQSYFYAPESRRIPFLIYGRPLHQEYVGKTIDRIVAQYDLPAILLNQLGINSTQFKWSKDIYAGKPCALYTFVDGIGFVTPNNTFAYDYVFKYYQHTQFESSLDSALTVQQGKAFMQVLFQEYLDY